MGERTPRDDWRDTLARMRAERAKYAAMASAKRQEAQDCRRRRDWLGALVADGRAREYRAERDQRAAEANSIRKQWDFR